MEEKRKSDIEGAFASGLLAGPEAIPRGELADMLRGYDLVTASGCRLDEDGEVEQVEDEADAQFWSVYGRQMDGEPLLECLADFRTEAEARAWAWEISADLPDAPDRGLLLAQEGWEGLEALLREGEELWIFRVAADFCLERARSCGWRALPEKERRKWEKASSDALAYLDAAFAPLMGMMGKL